MIQTEPSRVLGMPCVVAALVGGTIGWFLGGVGGALAGSFLLGGAACVIVDVVRSQRLPEDAARCVDAAKAFAAGQPDARTARGAAVREVLDDAIIVAVYHDGGVPAPRSYFRVRRSDLAVEAEPRERWWPRGLK